MKIAADAGNGHVVVLLPLTGKNFGEFDVLFPKLDGPVAVRPNTAKAHQEPLREQLAKKKT